MKKEYAISVLSLIILLLGFIACVIALFLTTISFSTQSILIIFGICFIVIGITSYSIHSTKYLKITYLKNNDMKVLAHWHYKADSSPIITDLINERRFSATLTAILSAVLFLVIAFVIYLTNENYSAFISLLWAIVSILAFITVFTYLPYYYNTQLRTCAETLVGEDSILFLDELFSLHHSMYLLEDIRIDYGEENTLQFLYGVSEVLADPVFTLTIPIPDGELETAKYIQAHYLDLITWKSSDF